jgi:hypothetical protein
LEDDREGSDALGVLDLLPFLPFQADSARFE